MVESSPVLDRTFAALSHPVRRAMLTRLHKGPRRVTELAAPFPISLAASSKHIGILESAGLISREIIGRDHVLSLSGAPLVAAQDWMTTCQQFWEERLDALDAQLRGAGRR
jgi:DNA-binding transcriptional ArsR family regulator